MVLDFLKILSFAIFFGSKVLLVISQMIDCVMWGNI